MGALFVVLGANTGAQTGDPAAAPEVCATVKQHNTYMRHALRYSHHGGDFRASRVTQHQLAKLGGMRSCLKHHDPGKYRLARGAWSKRQAQWSWHRRIDAATPFGKWAIPWSIVACESGGSWSAYNPSGASGPYQLLGWGAPMPANTPARQAQHHLIAARVWNGGAGRGNWVC